MEIKRTHSPLVGMENPTSKIVRSGEASKKNVNALPKVGDKKVMPKIITNK